MTDKVLGSTATANLMAGGALLISAVLGIVELNDRYISLESYGYSGTVGKDNSLTITQISGPTDLQLQRVTVVPTLLVGALDTKVGAPVVITLRPTNTRVFRAENALEAVCARQTEPDCDPDRIVLLDATIEAGGTTSPIELEGLPGGEPETKV